MSSGSPSQIVNEVGGPARSSPSSRQTGRPTSLPQRSCSAASIPAFAACSPGRSRRRASIASSANGSSPSSSRASWSEGERGGGRLVVALDRRRLAVAADAVVADLDVDHLGLVLGSARDDEGLSHPQRRDPGVQLHARYLNSLAFLPQGTRPSSASPGLAGSNRRGRKRARERDRLPVHRHLPAQRARDLVCRGRLRACLRGCGRARHGPRRGPDGRPHRRAQHAPARPRVAGCSVPDVPADPPAVASVRAARPGRRRHGLLLARSVDAALSSDPGRRIATRPTRSSGSA